MMFCPQCGKDVENGSFCNQCGAQIVNNEPVPQPEAPPAPEPPPQPEAPPALEPPPPPPPIDQPEPVPQPEAPPAPEPPPPPNELVPPPPPSPPIAYPPPPAQASPPVTYPPPQHQQAPPPYQHHQQYQHPPQGYPYPPAQPGFVGDVFGKTFGFLFKKPILLWGLSILFTLMTSLAALFGILPLIWLPIILVLQLGMANIFLCGYRGLPINAKQLFEGFSGKFFRNAGGMGWRGLWLLIWFLVPIAGPFIAVVKFYSYRFVPYIMLTNPDIHATDALKMSMAQTKGYKGKMFLTDLVIIAAVFVATLIFFFIRMIPFIGIVLLAIYMAVLIAFLPLIEGTLEAVYYDKISKENPVE